jgi:hypothetical protein
MATTERIRGRRVSIEVGEVPGVVGWTAIGIVTDRTLKRGCGSRRAPRIRVKPSDG